MTAARNAIVLLSGGMDSATCLAIAKQDGFACYAMSFRYGQRHAIELHAAERIAQSIGVVDHRIVDIDLRAFGASALTSDVAVPKDRNASEIGQGVPITYVPARNTIFLSYALAWAEVIPCDDIFIGVNALDYSGYPDCRPEFIASFQQTARLGTTRTSLAINTPLAKLTKAGIIKRGTDLGVDFSITRTCYDPADNGAACGHCDACLLRLKGFAEVGIADPAQYYDGVSITDHRSPITAVPQ